MLACSNCKHWFRRKDRDRIGERKEWGECRLKKRKHFLMTMNNITEAKYGCVFAESITDETEKE